MGWNKVITILAGLGMVIFLVSSISSGFENKALREAVINLEAQKKPLLNKIKTDSIKLLKLDFELEKKADSLRLLKNNIKNFKHEKSNYTRAYFNNDIDNRVIIFAKLAGSDSIQ